MLCLLSREGPDPPAFPGSGSGLSLTSCDLQSPPVCADFMSSSPNWTVSRPNGYPRSCSGVLELPSTSAPAHPLPQPLWPLVEPCYPPQPSNPDVGGRNRGQTLAEGRVAGHPNQPSTQAQPYQLKDFGQGAADMLTCPPPPTMSSCLRLPGPAGIRPSCPVSPASFGGCVHRVEMSGPGGSSEPPPGYQRNPYESRKAHRSL